MWELTSNEPPFLNIPHNKELALAILYGKRPDIDKKTPEFYSNLMKKCWNSDPSKRPDTSLLPKLFKEMREQCKIIDKNPVSSNIILRSSNRKAGTVYIKCKILNLYLYMNFFFNFSEYEAKTKKFEYTISTPPIDFSTVNNSKSKENEPITSDNTSIDTGSLPQSNPVTDSKEVSTESGTCIQKV